MTNDNIKTACHLAAKFAREATVLLKARERDDRSTHPKESGATRRASMELTRSLANMRSPK